MKEMIDAVFFGAFSALTIRISDRDMIDSSHLSLYLTLALALLKHQCVVSPALESRASAHLSTDSASRVITSNTWVWLYVG